MTTCRLCGRAATLSADDSVLWLDSTGARDVCSFVCRGCGAHVHALADEATIDALLALGAATLLHRVPLEIVERTRRGAPLTHDDVLDAHVVLHDDARFRAALRALGTSAGASA